LLKNTTVVPAVNQIEVHPYFSQPDVLAANAARGILSQAWSPIGGITFYREGAGGSTLDDATINQEDITNEAVLAWRAMPCFRFNLTDNPGVDHFSLPSNPNLLGRLLADLGRERSRCH
jgi:hypothetical protein